MVTSVSVRCIAKRPLSDPHLRISHICGFDPNGIRWPLTEKDAIRGVKDGKWTFYVERPPDGGST